MAHFLQKREKRKSEIEPRKRWNIEFPAGGNPYFESKNFPGNDQIVRGKAQRREEGEHAIIFHISRGRSLMMTFLCGFSLPHVYAKTKWK